MPTKIGRPPVQNPKYDRITVRLDKDMKSILERYCKNNNIDKATAVREAIKNIIKTHYSPTKINSHRSIIRKT